MSDEWQSSTNDYVPPPTYDPVSYDPPQPTYPTTAYEPVIYDQQTPIYDAPQADRSTQADDQWTSGYNNQQPATTDTPDLGRSGGPSSSDSSRSGGILGTALQFIQAAFGNDATVDHPSAAATVNDQPAWMPAHNQPSPAEPHSTHPTGDHRAYPIAAPEPSHQTPTLTPHRGSAGPSPDAGQATSVGSGAHRSRPIGDRPPTLAHQPSVDVRNTEARALSELVSQEIAQRVWTGGSDREANSATGPQFSGGAFDYLRGLAMTDLQATVGHLDAASRDALYAHLGEVDSALERERIEVTLRASACDSANRGGRTLPLAIVQELRSGGRSETGIRSGGAVAGLAKLPRAQLYDVLHVLPNPLLQEIRQRPEFEHTPQAAAVRQVLDDLTGTGGAMAAEDVIDVDSLKIRGPGCTDNPDAEMADVYNRYGKIIKEFSDRLGIDPSYVAAIIRAESRGRLFDASTGKPVLRFEVHHLMERWVKQAAGGERTRREQEFRKYFRFNESDPKKNFLGHTFRESEGQDFVPFHDRSQALEYRALGKARELAGDTALECASWGAGQIMGFNHKAVGFNSAREMAESFRRSGRSQIESIFAFIEAKKLTSALQNGDFERIAKVYNGPKNIAAYAPGMRRWQYAYSKVAAGRIHGSGRGGLNRSVHHPHRLESTGSGMMRTPG